jgi:hypothetical protein
MQDSEQLASEQLASIELNPGTGQAQFDVKLAGNNIAPNRREFEGAYAPV